MLKYSEIKETSVPYFVSLNLHITFVLESYATSTQFSIMTLVIDVVYRIHTLILGHTIDTILRINQDLQIFLHDSYRTIILQIA